MPKIAAKPLVASIDHQVVVGGDGKVDAAETAGANWQAAKTELLLATAAGAFSGAAAIDLAFNPLGLLGPKIVSGLFLAASGVATACLLGAAVKDTAEAAVWATIAGARHLLTTAR